MVGFIDLIEAVEHVGQIRRGDAHAGVAHADADNVALRAGTQRDDAALGRILEGVIQQHDEHLLGAIRIAPNARQVFRHVVDEGLLIVLGVGGIGFVDEVEQRERGKDASRERGRAALQAGELQHVVDQPRQAHGFAQHDVINLLPLFLGLHQTVAQRLDQRAHGGQRRAQLVGDVGNVVAAGLLQPLGAGHVGDDADAAGHLAALQQQRRNGDMQRDVALPNRLFDGLRGGERLIEHGEHIRRGGAHIVIGGLKVQQAVDGGVNQRGRALRVHGDDAFGKAVNQALQPVALHLQRGDGAAQLAGKVVERAPQFAVFVVGAVLRAGGQVAAGHRQGDGAHARDRPHHAGGEKQDDREHQQPDQQQRERQRVGERLHAAHDFGHGLRHEHRADDLVHERDRNGDDDEVAVHHLFGGIGLGRFGAAFAQAVHHAG